MVIGNNKNMSEVNGYNVNKYKVNREWLMCINENTIADINVGNIREGMGNV